MITDKGYAGQGEYDDEEKNILDEVLDTKNVPTFQSTAVNEIETAFRDYSVYCRERGEEPDMSFPGAFFY
jgi:predicted HicB family RNase H-like nuclease